MKKTDILKLLKLASLPVMALSLVIFTGCGGGDDDGEPAPTMTIAEIIASAEFQQSATVSDEQALDSLAKLIEVYPELEAMLSGSAEYTLFAPSNAGFKTLMETPGFPADIRLINADIVKKVLSYHIVSGKKLSTDLTAGTTVTGADGEEIEVNGDGTLLTGSTDDAIQISDADNLATNGVVHVTNKVLIPPTIGSTLTALLPTVAGPIALGADFTILWQGVQLADAFAAGAELPTITSTLTGEGVVTLFAPTNATFEAGELTANSFTGQEWYGILSNHIVVQDDNTTVTEAELTTGATFTTRFTTDGVNFGQLLVFNNTTAIPAQNGLGIYLDSNGTVDLADQTTYTTFDAEIAVLDVAPRGNGTVHVIAGVLSPTP